MATKTFARIENGVVVELLRTDGDIVAMFHPALCWIDVTAEPGVASGWHADGARLHPPSAE